MKMAILELEYKNIRKITALKLPFTKADGSVISNNFMMDCVQSALFRAYINGSRYR